MSEREQLELPMSWPAAVPRDVPSHGIELALGGYARRVRCGSEHEGRGFLYVARVGGDMWECGNCGRLYPSSAMREQQEGALVVRAR